MSHNCYEFKRKIRLLRYARNDVIVRSPSGRRGNPYLNYIHDECTDPGNHALPGNHSYCPLCAQFSFY